MRSLAPALVGLILGILVTSGPVLAKDVDSAPPLAPSGPTFSLGFKLLADQLGDLAGQPLEDEHWGANGDSLQQTTRGLLVWRKADNWTAFTDGATTWVNGPFGVQSRSNSESFNWETSSSTTPSRDADIVLYDRRGIPTAYLSPADENTVYLWTGEPVAYLYEDHLYGFNGRHLGWFQDGIIWDYEGVAIGYTREALTPSPSDGGPRGPQAPQPARLPREAAPPEPNRVPGVYTTLLLTYLRMGQ